MTVKKKVDYAFRSDITTSVLPYGVTRLSAVPHDTVSDVMKLIVGKAKSDGGHLVKMGVTGGITDMRSSWRADTVMDRIQWVRDDLMALKGKLSDG